jgi:hypothetical protein
MPSAIEINEYFINFSKKTGIPLESINAAGHEFYDTSKGPFGGNTGGGGEQFQ